MSSSLSNLYSQYLILHKTYQVAIQEYNIENEENVKKNVIVLLDDGTQKTFYVGKYIDLSVYYDTSINIKSINIYDGLLITLYKDVNCSGDYNSYMSTQTDDYSTQDINNTYKSLQVELLDKSFDSYDSKAFRTYSTPTISNSSTSTDCADLCANSNCTGAVFNSSLSNCSTYKTPGRLEKGTTEDEAIIPTNKRKLLIITELNYKLKNIIQQINASTTLVLKDNQLSLDQQQISLEEYYANKKKIEELQTYLAEQIKTYQSLESELTNSSSIITRNVNIYYLMWVFLVVLIIMIIKNIFKPNVSNPNNLIWIILVICILLSTYNINNPYGYLLWCILILIFILKIILPRIQ
jgi:hypothetical protein